MKKYLGLMTTLLFVAYGTLGAPAFAAGNHVAPKPAATPPKAEESVTHGSVIVEGQKINYTATAGTIILKNDKDQPIGSMFYVAYTKRGVKNEQNRPVTFFYNGGPGSSTIWLHMGAFGPQRIVTADHTHTPAAPYQLVNNSYSLLDATDEVFIDAMSTGYSRILGKDQGAAGTKADFYGYDADVRSFAQFITRYLSKNSRWNSPKYLYGESYGTLRSEMLANYLIQRKDMDLNGVVLQSAYTGGGNPEFQGDTQVETELPTFAADAWYYHKLPSQPAQQLVPFLKQVEDFAMNQYAVALNAGNTLSPSKFNAIAEKLHDYTGLDLAYIKKANLRVTAREFFHELLNDKDLTVGRLDGRFSGPSMDPLGQNAAYDPQAASISSAYAAGFNYYAHNILKYEPGRDQYYRPETRVRPWPQSHVNLMTGRTMPLVNGAIDMAQALKHDPNLQFEVDMGYYDAATFYYGMVYAINHLEIPKDLQSHIHEIYYDSGHMIYVHIPGLKKLHDNTADFIKATEHVQGN